MSQNKNSLTTTTSTGLALKNASKSLKITNKLLAEVNILTHEDWSWWNNLNTRLKYVLYKNSTDSFSPSFRYYHWSWSYEDELNFDKEKFLKVLKLEQLKIVFDPKLDIDISFLQKLKSLTQLHIGYIQIISICVSPILDFRYTLNLYNDPFSHLYRTDIKTLRKDYYCPQENYGKINYQFITKLKKLEYLYLNDENLTYIDFLHELINLKGLTIQGNIIDQDIFDYINISNLEIFCYKNGIIKNSDKLVEAKKLQILYLSNNSIEKFQYQFPLLKRLNLTKNNIKQISFDTFSPYLEHLCINENNTYYITNFMNLPNLVSLDLTKNHINDISELSYLHSLEYLVLDNNQVDNLTPVCNLKNLLFLSITNNQISKIPDFSNINLEELHLSNNNITDVSILAKNKSLKFLSLKGNPILETDIVWLKNQLPSCYISFFSNDIDKYDFIPF